MRVCSARVARDGGVVSSLHPGIARALPSAIVAPVTPREMKAEAIRLYPLTGLGKRECAREYGQAWSTVKSWLNPLAQDRTPPSRFVRFLELHAQARQALRQAREMAAL